MYIARCSLSRCIHLLTGLSEETRSNFHVMKDLGQHTRMGPDARVKTIKNFISDLNK